MSTVLHERRFSAPMHEAVQVQSFEFRGKEHHVGDTITYNVSSWSQKTGETMPPNRHEGVIAELWYEEWRGQILLYAEVDSSSGQPERVWFHRDHVGDEGDLGPTPNGALW